MADSRENRQGVSDSLHRLKDKKGKKRYSHWNLAGKYQVLFSGREEWKGKGWLLFLQNISEKRVRKQTKQGISYNVFEIESYTVWFTAAPKFLSFSLAITLK